MKTASLLFVFLTSYFGFSQFEYKDFSSYGSLSELHQYGGKYYGIPIGSSTIVEFDKSSDEINEYNIYNGFPMRWHSASFQIGNYIVVVNHDESIPDFRGFLSLNLDSKEHTFFKLDDVLAHYKWGPEYPIYYRGYLQSDHSVYGILNGSFFDKYSVVSYNPNDGLDSLDLSALPRNPEEDFSALKWTNSKFCAFTTAERFIIWDEDDATDYVVAEFEAKEYVQMLGANENSFYFKSRVEVGGTDYDSLHVISIDGEIDNLSSEFNLSNQSISNIRFVDDSLCIVYPHNNVLIVDQSTGIKTVIDKTSHDLDSNPINAFVDEEDKGLLLLSSNSLAHEYHKMVHHLSRGEVLKDIETNPNYKASYGAMYYPWVNKNNDKFFLRQKSFYVFDGEQYHQKKIEHPWFTDANLDEVDNYYMFPEAEDNFGNVYCSYAFNYSAWKGKDDTAFYIKIAPDYEYSFIEVDEFTEVVEQTSLSLNGNDYDVQSGVLTISDKKDNLTELQVNDSITRVFGWKSRVLMTSKNKIYLIDESTLEHNVIAEGEDNYGPYWLSNDRMGNFYFYWRGDLHKVPFYADTVLIISPPDTVGMHSNWLKHDWNGNIYANRTGRGAETPFSDYGYIVYNNGFGWDLSNDILTNLTYRSGYYELATNSRATSAFLKSHHSVVEIDCPCRVVDEIKEVYYIHDSSEYVQLKLNDDFEKVLWDDRSESFSREINMPGNYWVKVLNDKGCSVVKEFEVKLAPTSNYQNKDIFYYSSTNHFPLILSDDLQGDLFIYDLKGALVKQFDDYQNNWVPESSLTHSMMIYVIYNDGDFKHSGRMFFL